MDNHFKRNLYAIFYAIVVLQLTSAAVFFFIVKNEKRTIQKENVRFTSYLLADELRQSSDELTRMARTYAITGDFRYKDYFFDILDIRSGKQPRPLNYQNIYWDFAIVHGRPPIKSSLATPLKDLIKKQNISAKELVLLERGENLSDSLAKVETKALKAMQGLYKDSSGNYTIKGSPKPQKAIKLLHNSQYHIIKEKIMRAINEFLDSIKKRTQKEVATLHNKTKRLSYLLLTLMIMSIVLAFCAFYLITQEYKNQKDSIQQSERLQGQGKQLFKLWPFMVTAVVTMGMVVVFSWYSLQEVHETSARQVKLSYKSRLNEAHNVVTSWFDQMHLEIEFSAKLLAQNIPHTYLQKSTVISSLNFKENSSPKKFLKMTFFQTMLLPTPRES